MKKILDYAHSLLQSFVNQDDECIDMTIGNGNDTLFLARIAKHVYGFDIQKEAIEITQQKLKKESLSNVTLFCDSHANISN